MGPGDFVKVRYRGRTRVTKDRDGNITSSRYDDETPFTFMWDSRPYLAEVGKETFVPFEAASLALGDPRAGDTTRSARDEAGNVMWIVDRPTEMRRLTVLYDNVTDAAGNLIIKPDVTVTDLDGNEVMMVLDDPAGDSVLPAQPTLLDSKQLLAQIERQRRMIDQLAEAQGIEVDVATATADEPPKSDAKSDPRSDPFSELPEG